MMNNSNSNNYNNYYTPLALYSGGGTTSQRVTASAGRGNKQPAAAASFPHAALQHAILHHDPDELSSVDDDFAVMDPLPIQNKSPIELDDGGALNNEENNGSNHRAIGPMTTKTLPGQLLGKQFPGQLYDSSKSSTSNMKR